MTALGLGLCRVCRGCCEVSARLGTGPVVVASGLVLGLGFQCSGLRDVCGFGFSLGVGFLHGLGLS